MRRSEVIALRWSRLDLDAGTVDVRRNWVSLAGQGGREKDTNTHQVRRLALDPRRSSCSGSTAAGTRRPWPTWSRRCPSRPTCSRTPRCGTSRTTRAASRTSTRTCARNSASTATSTRYATALLAAGVDLRTVAGRLGHGGGGSTTLREYAAFVGESDRKAAVILGTWEDGDTLFLRCSLWRQAAENAGESLTKGTRVIVTGRLRQRSYTTTDGEKRTVIELDVDEIGPSLRHATATLTKNRTGEPAEERRLEPA